MAQKLGADAVVHVQTRDPQEVAEKVPWTLLIISFFGQLYVYPLAMWFNLSVVVVVVVVVFNDDDDDNC